MTLQDETILITGPASQVGFPVARALASRNRVFGLARFSKAEDRERVEALGVEPVQADLARDSLDRVPDDVSIVLHFAVAKSGDFAADLEANAEGAGRLLARCPRARAFLHCSSGGVYAYEGQKLHAEGDALGDNHRGMMPTYSIAKIAAETVVRFACREHGVPTTIARLSVPYGDNGGWPWYHLMMMKAGVPIPIHPDGPNRYNLIHEDDIVAMLPGLLEIASVPATTVNWGSDEPTALEDWCAYLGELTGLEPRFDVTEKSLGALALDTARLRERVGSTRVDWRDGIRRMVEARNPELLQGSDSD